MKKAENNPLHCDPVTGVCEIPGQNQTKIKDQKEKEISRPLKLVYFTDPICSGCWGIEPQLRRLKLEYGRMLDTDYRMGGLLPDWSYNSGGISKPSDVAAHWDEVSGYYQMPLVGDVWLSDPLNSSYPPSVAFKAAQIQDAEKAVRYMRILREMLFLESKNITRPAYLEMAAEMAGLNVKGFREDLANGNAVQAFRLDLEYARDLGVRGFPSLFLFNQSGNMELIYGVRPYEQFEVAVRRLYPQVQKEEYDKSALALVRQHHTLTAKELSVLADVSFDDALKQLRSFSDQGLLTLTSTRNGDLYKIKGYNTPAHNQTTHKSN